MPAEDLIKLPTFSDANTAPCVNMNFQIGSWNNLRRDLRNFFSVDIRFLGQLKKVRNYIWVLLYKISLSQLHPCGEDDYWQKTHSYVYCKSVIFAYRVVLHLFSFGSFITALQEPHVLPQSIILESGQRHHAFLFVFFFKKKSRKLQWVVINFYYADIVFPFSQEAINAINVYSFLVQSYPDYPRTYKYLLSELNNTMAKDI